MFTPRFRIISAPMSAPMSALMFAPIFALLALMSAGSAIASIPLGVAQSFGVLGGATVTNTGPTVVNGNVGTSPGAAVVGFPPGTVSLGTIHAADAVASQAQSDLTVAYNTAAGLPCNTDLTGQNLGGLTLTPGVYCFSTSAQLTGTLTLDSQNNPNAQFVFKTGSTLTTASGSSVQAINGSLCDKLYWQVGTSATLGTGSTFAGDVLALSSITLTTGSNTSGRALARNGAVTLDTNNVNLCLQVAAPTLSTNASPSILLGGGQLTDSATVSGRVNPTAGGSITFRLYGPNDSTCTNPPVFSPAAVSYPVAGGPVTSPGFTPTLIGTYRWIAAYSGDGSNPPINGVCNAPNESAIVSNVVLATPTLATTASPNVVLGGSITDSAIVSGRVNPVAGATVTFSLYGPGDATCASPAIFTSAVSYPVAGGSVSSQSFTPTLAGTYRWIGIYSGDANNAAVAGVCNGPNENVVVSPLVLPIPSISTVASPPIVLAAGSLTDSATVSGRINPVAGATVSFSLYGPGDATCTGPVIFGSVVSYPVAGGPVSSPPFTPTLAGTYRWIAAYSGDANNAPIAGVCNAPNESVVVSPTVLATTSISTIASPNVVVGAGTLSDNATVVGRVNPVAGATITFRLYGAGDVTCSAAPVFTSIVAYPVAGGAVTSTAFTATSTGTYRWIASYSGDANNAPVTAPCNGTNENVDVIAVAGLALPIPTLSPLLLLLLIAALSVLGWKAARRGN